ncbi:ABC transporter permease [Martelella mangrovi]|uniref:ABC-2 type transport system permease protein n=1 Tax=Martelella mangrovi TaxID=1397477 RepID=A0ABV2ICR9_9HYPH
MYLAIFRNSLHVALTYRGRFFLQVLESYIASVALASIWQAVYGNSSSVDGISLQEAITYSTLGFTVLTAWRWRRTLRELGRQIKSGDIAVHLLKPVNFPMKLFAESCGQKLFEVIVVGCPALALIALTYGLEPPVDLSHCALFLLFFLLSFFLMFLVVLIGGLGTLYLYKEEPVEWTISACVVLLSGQAIPLRFYPETVQVLITHLPFSWISFYPAAVYLGKVEAPDAFGLLSIGIVWSATLALVAHALWGRLVNHLTVQGG